MSIKRYDIEVATRYAFINECESEEGYYVRSEDHAAEFARLNEQAQALAAEIAQIKSAIESHAVGFVVCPVCSHEEPSGTDDVVVMVRDIDTPATDAAIREIGAEAIEGFADEWQGEYSHSGISDMARGYANKLRAGGGRAMTKKQYAERDAMQLDKVGNYYCRHVSAMTAEDLNSKGDIAAELGWRDMQIDQLNKHIEELTADLDKESEIRHRIHEELNAIKGEQQSVVEQLEAAQRERDELTPRELPAWPK